MNLVLIGLNHKTAPVQVREKLAIAPAHLGELLRGFQVPGVNQAAILSTCNRLEVYAVVDNAVIGQQALTNALAEARGVCARDFTPHLYVRCDAEAARHLCRVAAGLDSLLVGEHQILGQVKDALQSAQDAGTNGAELSTLFRQAIHAGKRARTETEIGQGAKSLGHVAVSLAREVLSSLENRTALLIGAGKISKLAGRALVESGLQWILVANRTFDRACRLAQELRGRAVRFDALAEGLVQADVAIVASGAPHIVLHAADVGRAMQLRAHRPLVVIDLAVPRNVDPSIRNNAGVYLYDMDDLNAVVGSRYPVTANAVAAAEQIAEEESGNFLAYLCERRIAPYVQDLIGRAEQHRQARVLQLLQHLAGVSPEQQRAIDALTKSLVNQVVYASIHTIRQVAATEHPVVPKGDGERVKTQVPVND